MDFPWDISKIPPNVGKRGLNFIKPLNLATIAETG